MKQEVRNLSNNDSVINQEINISIKNNKMIKLFKKKINNFLFLFQCYLPDLILIFFLSYNLFSPIIIIPLIFISFLVFLYNLQDIFLYQPNSVPQSRLFVLSPTEFGLPFENIFIQTPDGVTLHTYFIKQPPNNFPYTYTILYLHGNAGNIGHRLLNVQILYNKCHCNILLVEYRGYGKSTGTPSEEGLKIDSQSALSYLNTRNDIDKSRIILFGRSLGGAVAIATADFQEKLSALIIENTFTSIREIGSSLIGWPFIKKLPDWMFKNHFNSKEKIKKLKLPSMFISGLKDDLVPPSMMKILFENSNSIYKKLILLEFGNHNDAWRLKGYYEQINLFIYQLEQLKLGINIPNSSIITLK